MKISFKNKFLSNKKKPYFVSEIGINHNGRFSLAIEMIRKSKTAGFDAVKFQRRDSVDLLNINYKIKNGIGYLSKHKNDIPKTSTKFGAWSYPDERLELKNSDYKKIKSYCRKIKIDLIITPWDERSVDFVSKLGVKAIKIASIDANNYHFCEYVAKKRKPTIISTGMCTYDELIKTQKIFLKYKTPHMFLHCTSSYPCLVKDKNLLCIPKLQKILKTDIGFSGHGTNLYGSVGAVALGANVIEKHSTLSKKMAGPDHAASLEFSELENLINICTKVNNCLGHDKKVFLKSERMLHSILSRRLVARKIIKKGARLKYIDIKPALIKNQNLGYKGNELYNILNKKLKKDIKPGHIFSKNDFFN